MRLLAVFGLFTNLNDRFPQPFTHTLMTTDFDETDFDDKFHADLVVITEFLR